MRIKQACTREVICATADQSIREAAELMRAKHVGALVVVEPQQGERIPIGMLTDRDIVVAVVARSVDPDALTVADVMTRDPVTCDEDQDLIDAVELMRLRGVRRLPVVHMGGGVVGLVAVDDVHGALVAQLEALTRAFASEQAHEREGRP